jgi:uncharacterized repeat protein (TIGR02543 family)
VSNQTISHGSTATLPTPPTRTGYTFDNWYPNSNLTGDPYDFNSPITSNLTLYAKWTPIAINLTLDTNSVDLGSITPSTTGSYVYATNTATVTTNNPTGYLMAVSTNLPSSNTHASDMVHQSITDTYLLSTVNTCTWNNTTKALANTNNALAINTYGFTLTSTNLTAQKLCKIPNQTSPLTVKSTTTANETGDNTTFYYGTKIDLEQVAGDYKIGIVYSVTANP